MELRRDRYARETAALSAAYHDGIAARAPVVATTDSELLAIKKRLAAFDADEPRNNPAVRAEWHDRLRPVLTDLVEAISRVNVERAHEHIAAEWSSKGAQSVDHLLTPEARDAVLDPIRRWRDREVNGYGVISSTTAYGAAWERMLRNRDKIDSSLSRPELPPSFEDQYLDEATAAVDAALRIVRADAVA